MDADVFACQRVCSIYGNMVTLGNDRMAPGLLVVRSFYPVPIIGRIRTFIQQSPVIGFYRLLVLGQ
ncbi:hypothetical protein PISMIDRAFT_672070 [Pisolithus microcarpus 441]|uniref:Uncharacterized protein n=1 Tax=Pisolithus microcarpus 441 TaxID=765257 RepID=A0A0C9ZTX4_9AGAM|nr:hypothetical protein PISMIDRAFT_672070 [Pisolithus microcarpus 441]